AGGDGDLLRRKDDVVLLLRHRGGRRRRNRRRSLRLLGHWAGRLLLGGRLLLRRRRARRWWGRVFRRFLRVRGQREPEDGDGGAADLGASLESSAVHASTSRSRWRACTPTLQ